MKLRLLPLGALLLSAPALAQASVPDLLVTSRNNDRVLRYDGDTGALLGTFTAGGPLDNPAGITFGPDGNVYVSSANTNEVLRYDGATGAFLDVFAVGLNSPRNLNFGPDGHLYVANGVGEIVSFLPDGTALGRFNIGGNLQGTTSCTFGPRGDLDVTSVRNDVIKRFDGRTGQVLGTFVNQKLNGPHDVAFGPDGLFYVTNANQTRIRVYDPVTGAFLRALLNDPALSAPLGMQWDGRGSFYVANQGGDELRRYDAKSGAFQGSIGAGNPGELDGPLFFTFVPPASGPLLEPASPGVAGQRNTLRFAGFEPGRRAWLLVGTPTTPGPVLSCGAALELASPRSLALVATDESGAGLLAGDVPASLAGVTLWLQAVAPASCELTPLTSLTF